MLIASLITWCAQAIFIHADVAGAKMNSNYTSTNPSLNPSMFPDLPVYSGHFHLPHTVTSKNRNVTYVGSPYQQSFSEAGDTKRMLILDSDFRHVSDAPVGRVGREYYIGLHGVEKAEKGDIVRLDVLEGTEEPGDVKSLKERGVDVLIRKIPRRAPPRPFDTQPSTENAHPSDFDIARTFLASLNYTVQNPVYTKTLELLASTAEASPPSRIR